MAADKKNFGDGMYLTVLGCGSAIPKPGHQHSSQVLRLRDKVFMIDCGEGTQMQLLRYGVSWANLHRIFITHLHGDHCLGLPGLLSTMTMSGLDHPVHIYGPEGIEEYVRFIIDLFCREDADRLIPHTVDHKSTTTIYDDHSVTVTAFPLRHRVACVGYRFDEKPKLRHINREMTDFYGVPISQFGLLKQGQDYTSPDGNIIANARLTHTPRAPFSFAYCSDTAFSKEVVNAVRGVDLLYHEATFEADMGKRAKETRHSTSLDAATVAKDAQVGHLLIGHFSARYSTRGMVEKLLQESQTLFDNTIAAEDGMTLDFQELRQKRNRETL
ncbi:MAG: ribonuclease Z [Porphyromonas sp.]|nr:ribonuclease Z [Porphyromonas sp.]